MGDVAPQKLRTQLSIVSTENQSTNPRSKEDGILLVVLAQISGYEIRALIDSDATRNFISLARVAQCGLTVESHNIFPKLGDGCRAHSPRAPRRRRPLSIATRSISYRLFQMLRRVFNTYEDPPTDLHNDNIVWIIQTGQKCNSQSSIHMPVCRIASTQNPGVKELQLNPSGYNI